ncbi:MAG: tRNA uridine-5-carboxymethylaminomethyl(34) synthesis GTPase MnmE [Treponema sp.]|jgi:tRNA modification GTPase|nr:tRNA uridine-5-carboxymethylaminomethyl(34) synthesis GTPase MnmE [Treponema sp.]
MTRNDSDYGDDAPIAAIATAAGNSALTLIRCSGNGSIKLASSVFTASLKNVPDQKNAFHDIQGNTVIHGWIVKIKCREGKEYFEIIDEVLVSVFRAPKSYTGEDSLDICCHGGSCTGAAVMAVLKTAGFREALPGEFTFRAFMNGKIDLTRSESVMELVCAKTEEGRRHAVSRLCGSLQKEINEIKNILVSVLAGAEIFLDYSEDEISAEEDEVAGKLPDKDNALAALDRLKKLSGSWRIERIYQEGITCVIAGRPNAGKSSLFNMLLKEDRSIVTEVPGTTRDWIEAWVSIEGIPVRLIDTAGLRESSDSVEKIGVMRSRKLLQEADIVLYLIDGVQGLTKEDNEELGMLSWESITGKTLLLWNKCDAAKPPHFTPEYFTQFKNISPISAKTGEGLTELYSAVTCVISKQTMGLLNETVSASVGTLRQKNLVDAACYSLAQALSLADLEEPLDLIAPLLRDAVNSLGEITGEVSTADILEEMFSKFCVGK